MMENEILKISGLCAGYGKNTVLKDLSFSVSQGEVVTILGANGSGKSTLLKTLSGNLKPGAGTVNFKGRDIYKYSAHDLSKLLSLLTTDRVSPELMTGREVIEMGRYPYSGRFGQLTDRDKLKVSESVEITGTEKLSKGLFSELSDGERQRILFARAIAQEPELLIMDEPTAYLDIRYKLEMMDTIRILSKNKGITVIMSLHEASCAKDISDRIIGIKNGRIKAFGTPEEVFTKEVIMDIYDLNEEQYGRVWEDSRRL